MQTPATTAVNGSKAKIRRPSTSMIILTGVGSQSLSAKCRWTKSYIGRDTSGTTECRPTIDRLSTDYRPYLFWYKPPFLCNENCPWKILVSIRITWLIYILKQEGLYQNKVTIHPALQSIAVKWPIPPVAIPPPLRVVAVTMPSLAERVAQFKWFNRVFSHDIMAAILVSQNNKMAAMLVSQTNPVGVELFCSNKFA